METISFTPGKCFSKEEMSLLLAGLGFDANIRVIFSVIVGGIVCES